MIKDILRLKYQGGLSHERIAQSLSISKGAVAKYLSLAGAESAVQVLERWLMARLRYMVLADVHAGGPSGAQGVDARAADPLGR